VCKLSCSTQEAVGEIDPDDLGAAFRKRKCMPAMATADIDNSGGFRQLEHPRDATRLESQPIIWGCQAPALLVTVFKVLLSPIWHVMPTRLRSLVQGDAKEIALRV